MLKHQDEYLELLNEKFRVVGKPRRVHYSYGKIPDSGIAVEIKNFGSGCVVFIADKPRSYLHKFTTELDSFHLPTCVWLTRWSDKELEVDMEIGFFI
jgi:hypothetical protein